MSQMWGLMRIIAFVEDYKVTRKVLVYLGIYEFKRDRPPQNRVILPRFE